jgi:hypothetical protein
MSVRLKVYRPYRPTQELGRWLRILLGASMAYLAVSGIAGLVDAVRIGDLRAAGTQVLPLSLVPSAFSGPVASLASLLPLATGIVWLVWQHRSQSNLFALGSPGLRHTPGWAVGWWFVPFANLVMPYRTMRELGKGSRADGASRLLRPWWALQVLYACLGGALVLLLIGALSWDRLSGFVLLELGPLQVARVVAAGSSLLGIVQGLLAIRIVGAIDAGQLGLVSSIASPVDPNFVPLRPDVQA